MFARGHDRGGDPEASADQGRRYSDEGAALSRHARGRGAELGEEELPPELEGGEDSEEAFAQSHEGGQQHHCVGGEVVRLESVELKKRAEEAACR